MPRARSLRRTPVGTLMMTEITSSLSGIRRHKRREKEAVNE
jgi:hypothetical protein